MKSYCIGIDVGGTTVKCGVFTAEGDLAAKWEVPTNTADGGVSVLSDAAASVKVHLWEMGIAQEDVLGVGAGVPGPVRADGTMPYAVNLGWGEKDVAGELSDLLGVPAYAGNDANVAALGEMWRGGGTGARNLVMVTLGTGVGAGVILDGHIVPGAHGAGGELGHAPVEPNETERCNCGNCGCLEQMASATGIVRLARQELSRMDDESVLRGLADDALTAKAVFDACKEGDAVAVQTVGRFADYLGRALAMVAAVVDPEVFIVGGGVSNAGQTLLDCVHDRYAHYAFPACKETSIVRAELGNDAGIYGAARLALGE